MDKLKNQGFNRYTNPKGFWVYVGTVLALVIVANSVLSVVVDHPLVILMILGVQMILLHFVLAPTTLDLTGWTVAVMGLLPVGIFMLLGSVVFYALWQTFVGPHVVIQIQ